MIVHVFNNKIDLKAARTVDCPGSRDTERNSFMKKTGLCKKRLFIIFLAAITFIAAFPLTSFAGAQYPTIYIVGQGAKLTADGTLNGKQIYPVEIPENYIAEVGEPLIKPLMNGMLLNRWDKYNEGLYEAVIPFLAPFALGKNGVPQDKSGCSYKSSSSPTPIYPGSEYKLYNFNYDWRLDPVELAEQLNAYILKIKTARKVEKVNVITRCLGAEIMLAYFDRYGGKDINDCILCCLGFDGFNTIGAVFAGEIKLNARAIDRFTRLYLSTEEYAGDPTVEMLQSLITVLRYNLTLDLTADAVEKLFRGVKEDAFKRLMLESLATMPSFWSYIGDEYYEKAKSFLFGDKEEDYAALIEKIDNYHYNIMNRYPEILDRADADGVRMYNICKYGFQSLPVLGNDKNMSDMLLQTEYSSLGAVCADIDSVLPRSYILSHDKNYISHFFPNCFMISSTTIIYFCFCILK